MRVIANRDCYFTNSDTLEITNKKSIFEGSVYTVISKRFHPHPIKFIDDPNYYPNGVWYYTLLEQSGEHASPLFTELPDEEEVIETEVENELQTNK